MRHLATNSAPWVRPPCPFAPAPIGSRRSPAAPWIPGLSGPLLILATLGASTVQAAAPLRLSLEAAVDRGIAANPIVREARAMTDVTRSRQVGARVLLPANPWASVLVAARPEPDARDPQVYLHVEQQIEIAGQRGTRIRAAAGGVRVAGLREAFAVSEARAQIRAAYASARLAENLVIEARGRQELAERIYSTARTRVAAGAASEVDLSLAQAERGRVLVEKIDAESIQQRELTRLRRLIGLDRGQAVELTTALPWPIGALTDLEQLVRTAEERRRDLAAITATRGALDLEIARLRREAVPNPGLFMEVWRDFGSTVVGGGITLPLPIFRRNQGELAMAHSEKALNEVRLALSRRTVADEVEQAYRAVEAHRAQVQQFQQELLPAAERQLELVTEGWRAGKFDLFRVMTAGRELRDARRAHLLILGALWQAVIELDRAAGSP